MNATCYEERWPWRMAALRANLSHAQLRVLMSVEVELPDDDAWPQFTLSESEIGRDLNMSRSTVSGHLRAVSSAGWLVVTQRATNRSPAVYRLGWGEFRRPCKPSNVADHIAFDWVTRLGRCGACGQTFRADGIVTDEQTEVMLAAWITRHSFCAPDGSVTEATA